MVFTISPLVEEAKRTRFYLASLLHIAGGAAGGALLGYVFGRLGSFVASPLSHWPIWTIMSGLAVAYALREFGLLPLPIWNVRSAVVPFSWRHWLGPVGAAPWYGLGLGLGFLANTPYPTFHFMLVWVALIADPRVGMVAGLVYGVSRTVQPLVWGLLWPSSEERFKRVNAMNLHRDLVHRLNGTCLGIVGVLGFLLF